MTNDATGFSIGVDVGASSTRVGLVDSTGAIVEQRTRPTHPSGSWQQFVARLAEDVNSIQNRSTVRDHGRSPVGLALPGTLDLDRTMVVRCTGIPALEAIPVAADLAKRVIAKVRLLTDADAATWGEYSARTFRPRRFVHLRLGTGVACGAVIDGQLQRLDSDRTQHLDSLVVERGPQAQACTCGLSGCLETVASGAALLQEAGRLGFGDDLCGVERAIVDGNDSALRFVGTAAVRVVVALKNLVDEFRPDVICVGGGVLAHLPALEAEILQCGRAALPNLCIESARLGDDAGIIGAASLAASVSL